MKLEKLSEAIKRAAVEAIAKAVIEIPPDVEEALKRAYECETCEASKSQLGAILDNIRLARELRRPVCQDTGTITFYVNVGYDFPGIKVIERSLVEAVRVATREVPLRPNTVDPFTGKNPGDNTGRFTPYIHWEFTEGDHLEFTVVPKGGGSESPTVLEFPPPGEGVRALKRIVVDAVLRAGAGPCPPTIVGVGVGGGADVATTLAKKACSVRKLGTKHPDPTIAKLEEELYNALNELGIGAMGLGGKCSTVLGVHIEYAYRHPALYPVAVVFMCWAARRASVKLLPDGSYEVYQ